MNDEAVPMDEPKDGWPELTYRYVKHYFWEPQHLVQTELSIAAAKKRGLSRVQAVDERLRRQEVPLNYLLNVLLRITPASFRRACLEPFGIDLADPGLSSLSLRTPADLDYIQPDVHLESDLSRVFVEVKVDSGLGLPQIEKYVRRHAELDAALALPKRSYVLFIVKRDPLRLFGKNRVEHSFRLGEVHRGLAALLGREASKVTLGATTWRLFGEALANELSRRRGKQGESSEMLGVLVDDFLADLMSRDLLPRSPIGEG